MSMNILVDAVHLLSPQTGIGKYTFENCRRLQDLTRDHVRWYYSYGYISGKLAGATHQELPDNSFSAMRKLKSLLTRYGAVKSLVKTLADFARRFSSKSYDLYWQPNNIPNTAVRAGKVVTTIHDLSFLIHPDWHPPDRRKYMTERIAESIRRSDKIIAVSHFTKGEIIQYSGCDPAKISVIYNGIDHQTFKMYAREELEDFKQRHRLPDRYLLFVGSIEPRKNLWRLLKAYEEYSESNREALPLILVGFRGWQNREIRQMIHSLSGRVWYLGYLPDRELAYVYNLATVFIYPSLYEGFGIPPLEAMACGTPVLTSQIAAISEVCADAAMYIDPHDQADIKEKIGLLTARDDLRNELVRKGLARSREFTWEASAQKHWELFAGLMSGREG